MQLRPILTLTTFLPYRLHSFIKRLSASLEGVSDSFHALPGFLEKKEFTSDLKNVFIKPEHKGKKILIVEDDKDTLDGLNVLLIKSGIKTYPCVSVASASELLEKTAFDMVISDIRLPDGDGYEIYRRAKNLYPGVPVILVTAFGYDPNHTIVRASESGIKGIIFREKPLSWKSICDLISSNL
jgi:CheY-like chemotaxis protein